jgi:ribosomal protein S18 acetylase RimI-like enzyme
MTDDALVIRPATMADVAPLRALIESGYRGASARDGWTHEADLLDGQRSDEAMLSDVIGAPDRLILMAVADGEPIGCVEIACVADGRSYLGLLTVAPARQRGGLGKALLSAAEDQAMAHFAAAFIEMTVIRQRAELIAYYARRGYRQTGERRPFPYGDTRYGAPRRDDLEFVVLEKQLIRSAA